MLQRLRRQFLEQGLRRGPVGQQALGHAVMQQGADGLQLGRVQAGLAQQTIPELQPELGQPLDPAHGQTTVVGDVRGLGRPGRHRAHARRDQQHRAVSLTGQGFAVGQQCRQALHEHRVRCAIKRSPVNETGLHAAHAVAHGLQAGQQLLGPKGGQGVAALEGLEVMGHSGWLVKPERNGSGMARK